MPRFDDRAREELLEEYARLKAQNISDAQIARRFGVSQMTILRWKQRYGLAERTAAAAPAEAGAAVAAGFREHARPADGLVADRASGASADAVSAVRDVCQQDADALKQEIEWLRELAGRLLLENERLRAQLAGKLRIDGDG